MAFLQGGGLTGAQIGEDQVSTPRQTHPKGQCLCHRTEGLRGQSREATDGPVLQGHPGTVPPLCFGSIWGLGVGKIPAFPADFPLAGVRGGAEVLTVPGEESPPHRRSSALKHCSWVPGCDYRPRPGQASMLPTTKIVPGGALESSGVLTSSLQFLRSFCAQEE